jgi:hypothetical protein
LKSDKTVEYGCKTQAENVNISRLSYIRRLSAVTETGSLENIGFFAKKTPISGVTF